MQSKLEEFTELFRSVPEEENICVLDGDRISLQGLLEEKEIYRMLLKYQGDREFYVPSEEEIVDCTFNGYPSKQPVYKNQQHLRYRNWECRKIWQKLISVKFTEYIIPAELCQRQWNS